MDFARPAALGLLTIAVAIGWIVARGRRRRERGWTALGRSGRPPGDGSRAWLAAITLLAVAAAGPRWGRRADEAPRSGMGVLLVIDVSRSMAAQDAVPDRLGLAARAAEEVVRAVGAGRGGRMGVVAFAGRGVLRCPLTANLGAVVDVLRGLRPGEVRPGGTDLGAALAAAVDALGGEETREAAARSIVLLSDGEDLARAWESALPLLQRAGIAVHAIAVGDDSAGRAIPLPNGGSLEFEGREVRTRRDDAALAALAEGTGGAFVPLGLAAPTGLARLFAERITPGTLARSEVIRAAERVERYPVLVVLALAVGLTGGRPPRRGALLAGLVLMVGLGAGPGRLNHRGAALEAVRRGNAAFALGRDAEALGEFDRAARLEPGLALAEFNAAAALFRMGRYDEARDRCLAVRERADAALRARIDFALGNAAFAIGETEAALDHYDDCLASEAPGGEAARRDAGVNRAFVARFRLEQEAEDTSPQESEPGGSEVDHQRDRSGQGSESGAETPKGSPAGSPPPPGRETRDSQAGTPQERLEAALSRVREARSRRLPDEPLDRVESDRRDW